MCDWDQRVPKTFYSDYVERMKHFIVTIVERIQLKWKSPCEKVLWAVYNRPLLRSLTYITSFSLQELQSKYIFASSKGNDDKKNNFLITPPPHITSDQTH